MKTSRFILTAFAAAVSLAASVRAQQNPAGPTQNQPASTQRYKTMTQAIAALSGAKDEDARHGVYPEIGRLPLETPEQLTILHKEAMRLETDSRARKAGDPVAATDDLCRPIQTAIGPQYADALSTALDGEYKSIPKYFVGSFHNASDIDEAGFLMRNARLRALTTAIGASKDRKALSTLRKMVNLKGPASLYAVTAIGRIGDPADLAKFIARIEHDPKTPLDLSSFGPMAVDTIVQELGRNLSDTASGALMSSLVYMATQENRPVYQKLLISKDGSIQRVAAEAICRTATNKDGNLLIEITRSQWGVSRILAVRALGRNWESQYTPILESMLLHDYSPIVRAEVANVLATNKVTAAIPDLQKCMNDRSDEVRRAATAALKKLQ